MESVTVDEEPILFLRKGGETENDDEDPWDDTLLIKAYDRAVVRAKQKILKKVQEELNVSSEDVQGLITDSDSKPKNKNKKKKKKNKGSINWKLGDACRAVYSEDGEEYEAQIISIIDSERCCVRYLGYENEEEVLLSDLIPSLGKEVIKMQIKMAEYTSSACEEEAMETNDSYRPVKQKIKSEILFKKSEQKGTPERPSNNSRGQHTSFMNQPKEWGSFNPYRLPMYDHLSGLPPFPPPPPMPPSNFTASLNEMGSNGSDSFDSMLLSWYLCGFHTGYYARESEARQSSARGQRH